MSESLGNTGTDYAYNDAWSIRWRELNATLPPTEPTDEEIEAARTRLLEEVTFEDESEAADCDDLTVMAAHVLGEPVALEAYARTTARYARIGSILAAEGLTPPNPDDAEQAED